MNIFILIAMHLFYGFFKSWFSIYMSDTFSLSERVRNLKENINEVIVQVVCDMN